MHISVIFNGISVDATIHRTTSLRINGFVMTHGSSLSKFLVAGGCTCLGYLAGKKSKK